MPTIGLAERNPHTAARIALLTNKFAFRWLGAGPWHANCTSIGVRDAAERTESRPMRSLTFVAFGLVWWPIALTAQTIDNHGAQDSGRWDQPSKTGVIGATGPVNAPSYQPLSRSERWGRYIVRTFGPGAVLRAAAGSGINQWLDTPREWKQGGGAFGDRFGSSFTGYVIRQTLESGAAAALHEDDRYFPSTDTGFWKRTKHAVVSVFIARNQAGNLRFSYSYTTLFRSDRKSVV